MGVVLVRLKRVHRKVSQLIMDYSIVIASGLQIIWQGIFNTFYSCKKDFNTMR